MTPSSLLSSGPPGDRGIGTGVAVAEHDQLRFRMQANAVGVPDRSAGRPRQGASCETARRRAATVGRSRRWTLMGGRPRNAPLGNGRSVTVGHRLPKPLGLIGPSGCTGWGVQGEGVAGHDAGWPPRSPNRTARGVGSRAMLSPASRPIRCCSASTVSAARSNRRCSASDRELRPAAPAGLASPSMVLARSMSLLGHAMLRVGGQHEQHLVVADVDVRMVAGRLGGAGHGIDQGDRGREVGGGIPTANVVGVATPPWQ